MARTTFRFYQKKRGLRRTGSGRMGALGETVFFGIFLAAGCGFLALMIATIVLPEWRANHNFVQHQCTVLDKRIGESRDEDGTTYRPEIQIEYQVGNLPYRIWTYDVCGSYSGGRKAKEAILAQFEVGRKYPCWYDPNDPETAVLVRGYSWATWLLTGVPISFILIGGGGLIYAARHWGTSAERRAALARRLQELTPFDRSAQAFELPTVPDGSDIINSPGTRLRFRLPIETSPGWALLGVLLFCLFWNGIVSIFVAIAVRSHLAGDPEWFLTIFIVPFVLIGLASIGMFVRQVLITTGVGPTLVELSEHPLQPGQQCRLLLSQSGRLTMNRLRVLLVCEEKATYRQGTDTRTETRRVCEREIYCREGFHVQSGLPFEAEAELEVPESAMHSFKAEHNEIGWKIAVEGDVAGWPDFSRAFPVVVRPVSARATL